jgi:parallel beta-helix repeat protein
VAIFAFQKNGQLRQDNKSLLDEFGDSGLISAQSDGQNDKRGNLKNYNTQMALVNDGIGDNGNINKKQESYVTQSLDFFAKIGKDLFGIERETIFRPINKIIGISGNIETPKIIKVPEDYKSIQLAIENAEAGDTIQVAEGEYAENIVMKEGVNVIGASAESTIINGNNYGNVVSFKSGITNKTLLMGFTIKNSGKNLSGILIEDSSPLVGGNILVENEYGIYIKGNSSPVIRKNILHFNNKSIQIYNFEKLSNQNGSEQEIETKRDISGRSQDGSAQEYVANSNKEERKEYKVVIVDNLIIDNKVGIDLYNSSALINHNTISYNNHYKTYLGPTYGIYLAQSSAKITNNIITDSGICDLCAGISVDAGSEGVVISYNDVWNNKNNFVCFGECAIEDNNISQDPLYIDPVNGNYRLDKESALIERAGDGLDIGIRW